MAYMGVGIRRLNPVEPIHLLEPGRLHLQSDLRQLSLRFPGGLGIWLR